MSTTTNFKRIALVAVAALGLGVLSSVPTQAAPSSLTVTVGDGTATTGYSYDSSTAGTVAVSYLGVVAADSVTVQLAYKGNTGGGSLIAPTLMLDTTTADGRSTVVRSVSTTLAPLVARYETTTTGVNSVESTTATGAFYRTANFKVMFDTRTAGGATLAAGTYTATVIVTPYIGATAQTAAIVTKDVNIVVTAIPTQSKVADSSKSTAVLYDGNSFGGDYTQSDSAIVASSTAAATAIGTMRVFLKNAAGGNAQESVTVTVDKGLVSLDGGTTKGVSVTSVYGTTESGNGYAEFKFYPNGQAGKATITVKSTSVSFSAKSLSYYATSVASYGTPTLLKTVISAAANTGVVSVVAKDSENNSNSSATAAYAYSSDTSVVSNYGTACAYDADLAAQVCDLTGVSAGTAKITIRNKSTLALSTVASAEITVKVSAASVANFKITLDKATYSPGEKATLSVTALDKDGNSVPADTFANLFATGGITTSMTLGSASDTTIVNASVTTATSALLGRTTPVKTFTIYMPVNGGSLSFYATGGASVPLAAQVKQTTTVTVTDSGAAALAAVTALATTVASLRTLIVTLTNLVLKIQKKVKA
jgi:hypothetical protein